MKQQSSTNHAVLKLCHWSREVELEPIAELVLDLRSHFVLVRVSALNLTQSHGLGLVTGVDGRNGIGVACSTNESRHCGRSCQRRVVEVNPRQNDAEKRKNYWKRLKLTSNKSTRHTVGGGAQR